MNIKIREVVKLWSQAEDINDFIKGVKGKEITNETITEFESFLKSSYSETFPSNKVIEALKKVS